MKPLRILLVEDNPDHAALVEAFLEMLDRPPAQAVWVSCLQQGLDRLEAEPFHVVLLDLKLPDSGLTETLPRMLRHAPLLPVIVLTSLDDLDLALRAVQQGAQDYLVKTQLSRDLLGRAIHYAIERKRHAAELERSNRDLQAFARTVAHEIRDPLAVVRMCLRLIQQDYGDVMQTSVHQNLERSLNIIGGIDRLVRDLLQFAQVGYEHTIEPLDTGEVVAEALAVLQAKVAATGAVVQYEGLPTVMGNRTQLRQLFQNLLANALTYQDGHTPEVRVSATERDGICTFCVADNGIGFEEYQVHRLFRVFQRLHDRDRYPGTGLGLALCKRIVEQHGGRIWAEATLGAGASFYFTIPAAVAEVQAL